MRNNNGFKNLFKNFVIGFIIISSIYVLYFYNNNNNNNNNNTLENFTNCSNCKLNPSSNKCKPLYDISYSWNNTEQTFDISNVMRDYTFCIWEPNCSYNTMGNNIPTQEQRIGLPNTQLANNLVYN